MRARPEGGMRMRPHPRIRNTLKWGGLAALLMLMSVEIVSCWWGCTCRAWLSGGEGVYAGFGWGRAFAGIYADDEELPQHAGAAWSLTRLPFGRVLWHFEWGSSPGLRFLVVP